MSKKLILGSLGLLSFGVAISIGLFIGVAIEASFKLELLWAIVAYFSAGIGIVLLYLNIKVIQIVHSLSANEWALMQAGFDPATNTIKER